VTDSALVLLFIFVGLPVIGFIIYQIYVVVREASRSVAAREAEMRAAFADAAATANDKMSVPTAAPPAIATKISPALIFNIITIVIGVLVAVVGFAAWIGADPTNSALRQTVAALWLIAALLGLVIAAIGVLGVSLVHTLRRPA
jgi:hypothetical protein